MITKKKSTRFLAALLCTTCLAAALTGCGKDGDSGSNSGSQSSVEMMGNTTGVLEGTPATGMVDKLVATLPAASFDTSPFAPPTAGSTVTKPLMYATLIYRNEYGATLENCSMWLAKSVTKVDDLTYDIELHDNITDSQGNNINADDVIFSYEMSETLAQATNISSNMASLTKTGDYSLQMKMTKNAPGVIEDLLSNSQLFIVDKDWYESASDDERRNNPAVTGAYKLVEAVAGSSVHLEAVENYWMDEASRPMGARQNVKEIIFKVITDPAMRLIALENDEVDIAGINNSDLGRVFADGAPLEGYNVMLSGGVQGFSAFLNMDAGKSVLADNVDLRRAALYALNSSDVMYATGADEYTALPLKDLGTPNQAGYVDAWDDEDYFDYDPEKAAQYLEDAGYKPGEVTLRVMTSTTLFNDSVRAVLIANLEQAGFKVDSIAVDQALFNTYKNDSTQWDIMLDMKGGSTGHVAGLWDYCFNPAGYTNGSVCFTHDDELVRLLNEANTNPTDETMTAFHDYMVDQAICKGLYTTLSATASQDGILELVNVGTVSPVYNALVFSEDYQSVEE